MIASAITPAPTMPTRIVRRAISALLRLRRPRPRGRSAPGPPRPRRPARPLGASRSTAAPARRRASVTRPSSHERPTQSERREPLLVLGADVASLVDRLGIVSARALRIAGHGAQVADATRLARGLERHLGPLEVPRARDAPRRLPPTTPAPRSRDPWPRRRRPRRAGDRARAPPRGRHRPARRVAGQRQLGQPASPVSPPIGAGCARRSATSGSRSQAVAHPSCGDGHRDLVSRPGAQVVDAVGPLPRKVELRASEVAVGGGLAIDRPAQVEGADDGARSQVEAASRSARRGAYPASRRCPRSRR